MGRYSRTPRGCRAGRFGKKTVSQLQAVGLAVDSNTFDPGAENYTVVAIKADVPAAV